MLTASALSPVAAAGSPPDDHRADSRCRRRRTGLGRQGLISWHRSVSERSSICADRSGNSWHCPVSAGWHNGARYKVERRHSKTASRRLLPRFEWLHDDRRLVAGLNCVENYIMVAPFNVLQTTSPSAVFRRLSFQTTWSSSSTVKSTCNLSQIFFFGLRISGGWLAL